MTHKSHNAEDNKQSSYVALSGPAETNIEPRIMRKLDVQHRCGVA